VSDVKVDDETARLAPAEGEQGLCLLVVGPGGGVVHALPIAGVLTIGRSIECDVHIDDPSISRKHAQLVMGPPPCIRDLGSANGVRVSQRLLSGAELVPVEEGQAIELGSVVVVLHRPSMLRSPATAERRTEPPLDERPSLMPDGPALVRDPEMKRLYAMIERVAPSELSVLLLGETGVGKEIVAEAIHQASPRVDGPFLKLNCSAISEQLVESELFGHVRGAFTGAQRDKPGLLESAQGGTVFLDEIGELPLPMQAKLLRVLEERKVMRVGGLSPRDIDVRFVAATNRDLKAAADAGAFRDDLYFRLNGITLTIPPLRARPAEIEPLAVRFVARAVERGGGGARPEISSAVLARLHAHAWPGNVRELRNVMERAAVLAGPGPIGLEHMPPEILGSADGGSQPDLSSSEGGGSLRSEVEELERRRILDALERCNGNQTKAAELLGMPRRTFVKRLDAYGIARPRKGRK
jgi:DNA-binding NtrC family response regulator